jgi:hypothetical protein
MLTWYPDREDMTRVARAGFKRRAEVSIVQSVSSLFALITRSRTAVDRLNVFSHGAPGLVSLRGTVEPPGQVHSGRVVMPTGPDDGFSIARMPTLINRPEVDAVRKRFARKASVYLYVCDSGSRAGQSPAGQSPELLGHIARLFQARAVGLATVMGYYVDNPYDPLEKWICTVCVGSCEVNDAKRLKDFHTLERVARETGKHVEVSP